jgi:hypothetical protein
MWQDVTFQQLRDVEIYNLSPKITLLFNDRSGLMSGYINLWFLVLFLQIFMSNFVHLHLN